MSDSLSESLSVPVLACALAERQHGVVGVHQLYADGAHRGAVRHLIESGHWERLTPMVLRRNGSHRSLDQDLAVAVLDAGLRAGLSHHPAAAWFGQPGFSLRPFHVTRLRDATSTPSRLAIIHEPRLLPDHHLTVHRGIRVTVPSRIPFDIAAVGDAHGAQRALDRGWARGLLNHASMTAMLDDLAGRGRKGISLLRELIDERGPAYRPNDTGIEDRLQELAESLGMCLERQRDLIGGGEWLGRVDFLYAPTNAILEVDSALYHEALIDRRADEARTADLIAAGHTVHRFTDHEIFRDRHGTLARLRSIRSGA